MSVIDREPIPAQAPASVAKTAGRTAPRPSTRRRDVVRPTATPERAWLEWPGLARLEPLSIESVRSAVVVVTKPGDEVFALGGTLAVLASLGCSLRIVLAAAEPEPSRRLLPRGLGARRRIPPQFAAGLAALGAADAEITRLHVSDYAEAAERAGTAASASGSRAPSGSTPPAGAPASPAAKSPIADLVHGFDLCAVPWAGELLLGSGPVAAAFDAAATEACADSRTTCVKYPVAMWHWTEPGDPSIPWHQARRVDLPGWALERKRAAIACYADRLLPVSPGEAPAHAMPQTQLAHFLRGFETVLI